MRRLEALHRIAALREEADRARLAAIRGRLTALARDRASLLRGDAGAAWKGDVAPAALAAWETGRAARLDQIAADRAEARAELAAGRDALRQSTGKRQAVGMLIERAEREVRRRAARAAEAQAAAARAAGGPARDPDARFR